MEFSESDSFNIELVKAGVRRACFINAPRKLWNKKGHGLIINKIVSMGLGAFSVKCFSGYSPYVCVHLPDDVDAEEMNYGELLGYRYPIYRLHPELKIRWRIVWFAGSIEMWSECCHEPLRLSQVESDTEGKFEYLKDEIHKLNPDLKVTRVIIERV